MSSIKPRFSLPPHLGSTPHPQGWRPPAPALSHSNGYSESPGLMPPIYAASELPDLQLLRSTRQALIQHPPPASRHHRNFPTQHPAPAYKPPDTPSPVQTQGSYPPSCGVPLHRLCRGYTAALSNPDQGSTRDHLDPMCNAWMVAWGASPNLLRRATSSQANPSPKLRPALPRIHIDRVGWKPVSRHHPQIPCRQRTRYRPKRQHES